MVISGQQLSNVNKVESKGIENDFIIMKDEICKDSIKIH